MLTRSQGRIEKSAVSLSRVSREPPRVIQYIDVSPSSLENGSERVYDPSFLEEVRVAVDALICLKSSASEQPLQNWTLSSHHSRTAPSVDTVGQASRVGSINASLCTTNILSTTTRAPEADTRHHRVRSTMSGRKAKIKRDVIRAQWKQQAISIKSQHNGTVNHFQTAVLEWVYETITSYPTEPWISLIAIAIGRSFYQVKHWFANRRQREPLDEEAKPRRSRRGHLESHHIEDRLVRLRPCAIRGVDPQNTWTDQGFKDALDALIKAKRTRYNEQLAAADALRT
ncbi:hypothetical protein AcW1_000917 [Taiwanofungus camphoratus]|nr:hypothetical protein AcW2_000583 [Antrodia cinnamomea]KAI0936769.1 hypothetical protein AcV5_004821 [Antrodia cinnamomea]KAI0961990.1 hypothetical protein AcV7_000936 [Antrodia cinnamomea]KAI0963994.1 hypothetical protein AcW1_000917 [Antrodia cinnamomea]